MPPRYLFPFRRPSTARIDELEISYRGYPSGTHWPSKRLVEKPSDAPALVLEAWAQGYLVGSLVIMAAITVANMRRGVLLHKLILVELLLGLLHGTFIFADPPVYGWYLSTTAILLNMSWSLHNVIAWMKTKPFLSRRWSLFYIVTVALAQPYWVIEITANFLYFNNIDNLFVHTRPYEALFRDPWWIFSTINLFYNIVGTYRLSLWAVIRLSPRFGVLLCAMCLSIIFIVLDIVSVTGALKNALPDGLNPFWKLAFVFKCLTDSIVLDDFKTALDRLTKFKLRHDVDSAADEILDDTAVRAVGRLASGRTATAATVSQNAAKGPFAAPQRSSSEEDERASGAMAERRPHSPGLSGKLSFQQMLRTNTSSTHPRDAPHRSANLEPWDELDLPAFETSSATLSEGSGKQQKHLV